MFFKTLLTRIRLVLYPSISSLGILQRTRLRWTRSKTFPSLREKCRPTVQDRKKPLLGLWKEREYHSSKRFKDKRSSTAGFQVNHFDGARVLRILQNNFPCWGVLGALLGSSIILCIGIRKTPLPTVSIQPPQTAHKNNSSDPFVEDNSNPFLGKEIFQNKPVLASKIDALLAKKLYRRAFWGLEIRPVDGSPPLYARNSLKYFIPASNVKVFTTAAALDRLGPNFRFQTKLAYEGRLHKNGLLNGNLVLIGGGDPSLANNLDPGPIFLHLDNMVREAHQAGIRIIEGDVIGDDSFFPHAPYGRGWKKKDLEYHYAPRISALSFFNNVVNVVARPGAQKGHPILLLSHPVNSLFQLVNLGVTVANGLPSQSFFSRSDGSNKAVISGHISVNSAGWSRQVIMEDPALYTATLLNDRLRKQGIQVRGSARSRHTSPPDQLKTTVLHVHESPPLIEVIFEINKKSHNLYAEIVLRTLGAVIKGQGTDSGGLEVVYELLQDAGVPLRLTDLNDGSGLSAQNLVTPRSESMLLKHLAGKPYFPSFLASLPISSRDGTLQGRMHSSPAKNRVFAKTGTLANAITLAGYIQSRSSDLLAFSILVNDHRFSHYTARQGIDQICSLLANQ